jgi:hypothetical protein
MAILATAMGSALALGSTGYAGAAQKAPAAKEAPAAPAATVVAQQCDFTLGTIVQFCLNAWSGGPYVKSFGIGYGTANNSFQKVGVNRCHNGDYTTSGCPGTGDPAGLYIFQIKDTNNGKCISNSPGNGNLAYLGKCNATEYPGGGGDNGTLFISKPAPQGSDCDVVPGTYYINNYWTSQNGGWPNTFGLSWSPEANGSTVVLSSNSPKCLAKF